MFLIYCAGSNPVLAKVAQEEQWLLGVRSDRKDYGFPISFVDIEYRQPDWSAHLARVKVLRPWAAIVPDLSDQVVDQQDVARAVKQSEQLQRFCRFAFIVPKLPGQIALIPREFPLAYSVPTSYGGALYPWWELEGRRVHLLGGSPHMQMQLYRYISNVAHVLSADGNMAQKLAISHAKYWQGGRWRSHPQAGQQQDLYPDCLRRSLRNIRLAWRDVASMRILVSLTETERQQLMVELGHVQSRQAS